LYHRARFLSARRAGIELLQGKSTRPVIYWTSDLRREAAMRNNYGLRAVGVVLLMALGCRWGVAQVGPRYVIELNGKGGSSMAQGRMQPVGRGMVLISFQGLTVLTVDADAEAYSQDLVSNWPAADLLLVTPATAGRYDGLAPLHALRDGLPVVVAEPSDSGVPPRTGGPTLYPMQPWNALELRKQKTRLRVTAMPGSSGTTAVAGYLLDIGDSRASYRVYLSRAGTSDGALQLAQRLPGADVALLPGRDGPHLLALNRGAPRAWMPAALKENGYAFTAIRR
jgi:hypothetical protein